MSTRIKWLVLFAAAAMLCAAVVGIILYDAASAKPVEEWTAATTTAAPPVIDLNTATVHELCQLDEMTEEIAQSIIAYREQFGKFRTVNTLLDVHGVTRQKLEQWRPYLTV